jgi:nanoRNase/pAp phosphatase (c-di-AMP/oligoRNAs hydrolase)
MEPNQTNAKAQAIARIKEATNVLVTVSASPSVDQLSAAIGLTLLLNKLGKHGTAVFSGDVPSTLEFLQPEKTLETTTDSLRDFIISLDKSKADKLRYKVEEKVVKIFITPYRTSLSQDDLEFSQGDFNVDTIITLGVEQREDLDQAVLSQARILHDATIISVSNKTESSLGSINWYEPTSSSLCEMLVILGDALKAEFLDPQMATAFLTGIVAETERFSNDKTSPRAMTVSGRLMTAGANQQLIATKLEEEPAPAADVPTESFDDAKLDELVQEDGETEAADTEKAADSDGTLQIGHTDETAARETEEEPSDSEEQADKDSIHIDSQGTVRSVDESAAEQDSSTTATPSEFTDAAQANLTDPPILGHDAGPATQDDTEKTDKTAKSKSPPLTLPPVEDGDLPQTDQDDTEDPVGPLADQGDGESTEPSVDLSEPIEAATTVADLEEQVKTAQRDATDSEYQDTQPAAVSKESAVPDENQARDEVNDAIITAPADPDRFGPRKDAGAETADLDLGHSEPPVFSPQSPPSGPQINPNDEPDTTFPPNLVPPESPVSIDPTAGSAQPAAPPPVPPPMPPIMPPNPSSQDQADNPPPSSNNPFTLPPQQ